VPGHRCCLRSAVLGIEVEGNEHRAGRRIGVLPDRCRGQGAGSFGVGRGVLAVQRGAAQSSRGTGSGVAAELTQPAPMATFEPRRLSRTARAVVRSQTTTPSSGGGSERPRRRSFSGITAGSPSAGSTCRIAAWICAASRGAHRRSAHPAQWSSAAARPLHFRVSPRASPPFPAFA
jgi:hypothetical protein